MTQTLQDRAGKEIGWSHHNLDENGRPAGGETHIATPRGYENPLAYKANRVHIFWQNGPLREQGTDQPAEKNGAFVEDLLIAAIDRIDFYQEGEFACRENALIKTKIQEALHWCYERTDDRLRRGVEGTHQK